MTSRRFPQPRETSAQLPNLGAVSTIVSELPTRPSHSHLVLSRRITPVAFSGGLARTSSPSRPSFHTLPNRKSTLVDNAHSRGSTQTLADFIAALVPSLPTTNDLLNLTFVPGLFRYFIQTTPLTRSLHSYPPPLCFGRITTSE